MQAFRLTWPIIIILLFQKNVKPKPETDGKKGFVCKICGYIYEGDTLQYMEWLSTLVGLVDVF